MIEAESQHHALIEIALCVGIAGSDRHAVGAHALKKRRPGSLGDFQFGLHRLRGAAC